MLTPFAVRPGFSAACAVPERGAASPELQFNNEGGGVNLRGASFSPDSDYHHDDGTSTFTTTTALVPEAREVRFPDFSPEFDAVFHISNRYRRGRRAAFVYYCYC